MADLTARKPIGTMVRQALAALPRPATRPACPSCGELLRAECIRAARDRRAVRVLPCRCGHQEGHEVDRVAIPA